MYNIYSALSSTSTDYGINYMKVFYDTLMIGVKCKDDGVFHSYYNHVLLDKINYSYDAAVLQSDKSIILNLGLSNSDIVSYTGNELIDTVFDQNKKEVTIFTLSGVDGSFVPKIYKYNINNHNITSQYPSNEDKGLWINTELGSLTACHPTLVSIQDKTADMAITSVLSGRQILNILTFDITNNIEMTNFVKYEISSDMMGKLKKMQRVDNELQFYSSVGENLTPFKIVDK